MQSSLNKKILAGLISVSFIFLLIALFLPEKTKSGEPRKLYHYKESDLKSLTYKGPVKMVENGPEINLEYKIIPEAYPYKAGEYLWKVNIEQFPVREKWPTEKKWHTAMERYASVKTFYGLNLIRSIVQDFVALEYLFELDVSSSGKEKYGFEPCRAELTLEFTKKTKSFCLGDTVQNKSRRYVREKNGNTYLMADYIFRRLENNIFAQKNLSVSPYNPEDLSYVYIWPEKEFLKNLPETREILKEKLSFQVRLHSLPGEKDRRVWYLENDLLVPPSHAAVTATELLRIETEFAENIPDTCKILLKAEAGRISTDKEPKKIFQYTICENNSVLYLKSDFTTGRIKPASWKRLTANLHKMNTIIKENTLKKISEQKAPTPQKKKAE